MLPTGAKLSTAKIAKRASRILFPALNHALDLTVRLGKIAATNTSPLMSRPVTLFTGQWADLPSPNSAARKVKAWATTAWNSPAGATILKWTAPSPNRITARRNGRCSQKHGLNCFAISTHLVGQAVCDLIDERHKAILPADVWGDGKPEGVRQRAAEKMKATARAARKFFDAPARRARGERRSSRRRQRLHRLVHLARGLCVSADEPGISEQGLRRFRQTLAADSRRV